MNILIIYAQPEPKSFNQALKDLAVSELNSLHSAIKRFNGATKKA